MANLSDFETINQVLTDAGFNFVDMGVWEWQDTELTLQCHKHDDFLLLSELLPDSTINPLGLHFVIPNQQIHEKTLLKIIATRFSCRFMALDWEK